MKKISKFFALALFPLLLTGCGSNGGNSSSSWYSSSTYTYHPSSSTSTATGSAAIINYLNKYGSGNYHEVVTGSSDGTTKLGYEDNLFYMSHIATEDTLSTIYVSACSYQSSYGTAIFSVYVGSTCTFETTLKVYYSSHKYSSMSVIEVSVNKYTSQDAIEAIAALTIFSATSATNNASTFLSSKGLPYVI